LKGVEFTYMVLTKALVGALGIRDFDVRYTVQYKLLENAKLVSKFNAEKDDAEESKDLTE
ncbi:MAG: hypothetical protein KGH52_03290, partial [Candidatus Micrarchaeota archaeon]|nr:hypothetical protein [Candidatus Micrarchaeota archaeon]